MQIDVLHPVDGPQHTTTANLAFRRTRIAPDGSRASPPGRECSPSIRRQRRRASISDELRASSARPPQSPTRGHVMLSQRHSLGDSATYSGKNRELAKLFHGIWTPRKSRLTEDRNHGPVMRGRKRRTERASSRDSTARELATKLNARAYRSQQAAANRSDQSHNDLFQLNSRSLKSGHARASDLPSPRRVHFRQSAFTTSFSFSESCP